MDDPINNPNALQNPIDEKNIKEFKGEEEEQEEQQKIVNLIQSVHTIEQQLQQQNQLNQQFKTQINHIKDQRQTSPNTNNNNNLRQQQQQSIPDSSLEQSPPKSFNNQNNEKNMSFGSDQKQRVSMIQDQYREYLRNQPSQKQLNQTNMLNSNLFNPSNSGMFSSQIILNSIDQRKMYNLEVENQTLQSEIQLLRSRNNQYLERIKCLEENSLQLQSVIYTQSLALQQATQQLLQSTPNRNNPQQQQSPIPKQQQQQQQLFSNEKQSRHHPNKYSDSNSSSSQQQQQFQQQQQQLQQQFEQNQYQQPQQQQQIMNELDSLKQQQNDIKLSPNSPSTNSNKNGKTSGIGISSPQGNITGQQSNIFTSQYNNNSSIITTLCQIMGVKNESKLVEVAAKYTQCIKILPKLEKFIDTIFDIVFPTTDQEKDKAQKMQMIIPTLEQWSRNISQQYILKQQCQEALQFRNEFLKQFGEQNIPLQNLFKQIAKNEQEYKDIQKYGRQAYQISNNIPDSQIGSIIIQKMSKYRTYHNFIHQFKKKTSISELNALYSLFDRLLYNQVQF